MSDLKQPDLSEIDLDDLDASELREVATAWAVWHFIQTTPTPTQIQLQRALGDAFKAAKRPLIGAQKTRFAQYAIREVQEGTGDEPRDIESVRQAMFLNHSRLSKKLVTTGEALIPSRRELATMAADERAARVKQAGDTIGALVQVDTLRSKLLHLDKWSPEQALASDAQREEVVNLLVSAIPELLPEHLDRIVSAIAEHRGSEANDRNLASELGVSVKD